MLDLDFTRGACLKGDWVQVGVWRGGGALFLRALMKDIGHSGSLHLFDTFDDIPIAGVLHNRDRAFIDALGLKQKGNAGVASVRQVERLFQEFELDEAVILHAADIRTSSVNGGPSRIAVLHLDVDFYEPTFESLSLFYDSVIPGGIIIIDDYYMELLNCKKAVDDFFEERNIDKTLLKRYSSYSVKLVKPE